MSSPGSGTPHFKSLHLNNWETVNELEQPTLNFDDSWLQEMSAYFPSVEQDLIIETQDFQLNHLTFPAIEVEAGNKPGAPTHSPEAIPAYPVQYDAVPIIADEQIFPGSAESIHAWQLPHSWTDSGPTVPHVEDSLFAFGAPDEDSFNITVPPLMMTLLPRSAEDLKAIRKAMQTGDFEVPVYQSVMTNVALVEAPKLGRQKQKKSLAHHSLAPVIQSASVAKQDDTTGQPTQEAKGSKRKASDDNLIIKPPVSKWICADESPQTCLRLNVSKDLQVQYEETASEKSHLTALNTAKALLPRTAAQLIMGRTNRFQRKHILPWGLQRVLTEAFIQKRAAVELAPMPPIFDNDVRTYCQSNSSFDPVQSTFTPESIDIRLLGDIEFTAEEFLAFFPNHLRWHDAIYRLVQNGWSCSEIAAYINHSRDLKDGSYLRANTVLKWLQDADKDILDLQHTGVRGRKSYMTTNFAAGSTYPPKQLVPQGKVGGWTPNSLFPGKQLFDYHLVDLADGLVHWPTGDGVRLLTRAVRFAVEHGHQRVKLSQTQDYIRQNLLIWPLLPSMAGQAARGHVYHPDVVARDRFRAAQDALKEAGGEVKTYKKTPYKPRVKKQKPDLSLQPDPSLITSSPLEVSSQEFSDLLRALQ